MRRRRIRIPVTLAVLECATVLVAAVEGPRLRPSKRPAVVAAIEGEKPGLVFRLSNGADESVAEPRPTVAPATDLDEPTTAALLARLPPLPPTDEKPFALRERSLPPPRTGRVVAAAFPPAAETEPPPTAATGPLEVLRFQPEGSVPIAPQLSVTFSQPMVAVGSADEAAAVKPVRLAPEPPGQWRWVGTKTLLFEPRGRFPMATDYRAEVPAGTRGARGGVLATPVSFAFETPAATIVASHPSGGPARRDPLLFVAFDQRMSPDAVIAGLTVGAAGQSWKVRLARAEDVAADAEVKALVAEAPEGQGFALRPEGLLPADAEVTVTLAAGTPSAEGPKRTAAPQSWSFRTFGPMRVVKQSCGANGACPPFAPWQVEFSNPIDARAFRKDMVKVVPELPGLKAEVYGSRLALRGLTKGRTRYTVTLGGIPDAFGQSLAESPSLTFEVGKADSLLYAPGGSFVVLDPEGPPRFPVYSTNHSSLRVRAFAVTPADWPAFLRLQQEGPGGANGNATPPGRLIRDTAVEVRGVPDELTETRLDLAPFLPNRRGHVVLLVDPIVPNEASGRSVTVRAYRQSVQVWIEATQIGLDAFSDNRGLLVWATSLRNGMPLRDASVRLLPGGGAVPTAGTGLASLPLGKVPQTLVEVRLGDDVAILPANVHWGEGWKRSDQADELRFYVADDRHLYRPGEEVHVKGWLRRVGMGPDGDVREATGIESLAYALKDSENNVVARGTRPVGSLGAFDLVLKLPPTMNLGNAFLEIDASGHEHRHWFEVQEFRRPEFEVTAAASEGPFFVGGHATLTVAASYYAGGGLPDAETTWTVTATPASFTPPNRGEFVFGTWTPWWRPWLAEEGPGGALTHEARTDSGGRHVLRVDFDRVVPPRPTRVLAQASVLDVNRQAWTGAAQFLVHPSSLYVGMKTPRPFARMGDPLPVELIVTDLDGKAVEGRRVGVRADRLDWEQVAGEWKETVAATEDCPVVSAAESVLCSFRTDEAGSYRVTATVADDRGHENQSELRIFVAGGRGTRAHGAEEEEVTLIPDRKDYAPGETAEVLVIPPFTPAEGLLILERSGIVRAEPFRIDGDSHTLRIPIEDGMTPGVSIQVDVVGAARREDAPAGKSLPPRPAFASGGLLLGVPPRARTLAIEATPRVLTLAPGEETFIDLRVRDAAGRPVNGADVAVVVADEAVLALTGYRLPNPLAVFYVEPFPGVLDVRMRSSLLLASVDDLLEAGRAGPFPKVETSSAMSMVMAQAMPAAMFEAKAGGIGRRGSGREPIQIRKDFKALALFAASLPTDAEGRASVKVKVPDNLTRYRVMAVAAAGATEFGSGEATITARLPLMIRPSAPRFLNFGDRFELPVVVQNQTDEAMTVDLAVRAGNAAMLGGAGRRVRVPANNRVEVRFPAEARRAGRAVFQVGGASGAATDAAEVELPVFTPATTEAFATYGQIDEGAVAQPVATPKDVTPGFGGLEITTSSTALQALTDAVLYLVAYPFECAEQLSSRVLAVASLKDVLGAFSAEGLPATEEMTAAVKRDLDRLRGLQDEDGGFAFWRRGDPAWPYVSIHVAHALERARAKGFAVPKEMIDRSSDYLRRIEAHIPDDYPQDARRTLVAYALYVRHRLGEGDPARARALLGEAGVEGLSFEALGWLLPVLSPDAASAAEVTAIRRHLANRATETAAAAHFTVDYGEGQHLLLHSNRRADAVLLEALIADQPQSDLIPKLVEGLLGHRTAGRWQNTQENAFVLLALDRYFETYEKTTPDFMARAWLGPRFAGEHAFRGRSTERHHLEVPLAALGDGRGPMDLTLAKDGPGRLYYRIGMRYAPASLVLAAADRGFVVERAYEGADRREDVSRDHDGTWRIQSGARVRVRLTLVATGQRNHVALVDPLPAGLEALNPALRTTVPLPEDDAPSWSWWRRPWFDHQNLRDDRVEAFTSLLREGVHTYSYVARATTPGSFVVPPARAEEMYDPETFGRTATDRVIVE